MTWKGDLRRIPAPEPSKDLLERILASRAAGVRVVLPAPTRSLASTRAVRFAATAAILAGVAWLGWQVVTTRSGVESELPPVWVIGGVPFIPSAAFGQERFPPAMSPRYPLIAQIQPTRVRAGRWTYEGSTTGDGVFTTSQGPPRTIVIAAGNSEGQPIWVASSSPGMLDTVLVDRVTLRPLRYVRPMRHARLVQHFSHDSIDELLYIEPSPKARERTLRGAVSCRITAWARCSCPGRRTPWRCLYRPCRSTVTGAAASTVRTGSQAHEVSHLHGTRPPSHGKGARYRAGRDVRLLEARGERGR